MLSCIVVDRAYVGSCQPRPLPNHFLVAIAISRPKRHGIRLTSRSGLLSTTKSPGARSRRQSPVSEGDLHHESPGSPDGVVLVHLTQASQTYVPFWLVTMNFPSAPLRTLFSDM
jgi:hypothetical protein